MKHKRGGVAELGWLLGVIFCALGVCLSAKSGFGVSMIAAPPFVVYRFLNQFWPNFTFGMGEYLVQAVLILGLSLVLHRFKWKYLLSFATAVLYGLALDGWRLLFGTELATVLWQRIVFGLAGAVITSFAVSLFLRTYLPLEAYELVVKEVTDHYHLDMNKVKWVYDLSSLAVSILLMLILFRRFSLDMVGIGTLVLTLINAPMIAGFGKLLERRYKFTPAWPNFYVEFERLMN